MSKHHHPRAAYEANDAGSKFAALVEVRALVERVAGLPAEPTTPGASLNGAATISAAYDAATPISQLSFDLLAAASAQAATAGVEALLGGDTPSPAAAETLAQELAAAQLELERLLGI
jgi:hypothetical protein